MNNPYYKRVLELTQEELNMLRHILNNATSSADEDTDNATYQSELKTILNLRYKF